MLHCVACFILWYDDNPYPATFTLSGLVGDGAEFDLRTDRRIRGVPTSRITPTWASCVHALAKPEVVPTTRTFIGIGEGASVCVDTEPTISKVEAEGGNW